MTDDGRIERGPRTDRSERVVVTSPQTAAARRGQRAVVLPLRELQDQTGVGEALVRSLVRAQLALALRVLLVFAGGLAGLPALFALAPRLGRTEALGVPLPWLLLGLGSFPLLVVLALLYLRQAERNETDFEDLVGHG